MKSPRRGLEKVFDFWGNLLKLLLTQNILFRISFKEKSGILEIFLGHPIFFAYMFLLSFFYRLSAYMSKLIY